jgi:hypothetical protein
MELLMEQLGFRGQLRLKLCQMAREIHARVDDSQYQHLFVAYVANKQMLSDAVESQ